MPKYRLRQVHQITMLYIFWFLHQTTTGRGEGAQKGCCISFDSYIKPQLASCCFGFLNVVYLLIPTSNHNPRCDIRWWCALYIFWFLHQTTTQVEQLSHKEWLYIFWFLHQTTTLGIGSFGGSMLYIFWILHQTTTAARWWSRSTGCISFESYIKPQRNSLRTLSEARCISFESYIKPQLIDHVAEAESSCISFESYIKPQHSAGIVISRHCCISFESYIKPQRQCCLHRQGSVVYLLNPTSNHNSMA